MVYPSKSRVLDKRAVAIVRAAGPFGRFSAEMRNFVRILIEGDRIGVLPEVRALYETSKDAADGVAKATIESAFPLTDAQVVLGRLDRRCLPRLFGPVGDAPIDPDAAQGFFHEFSGWIVFVFAFAMILGVFAILTWFWLQLQRF